MSIFQRLGFSLVLLEAPLFGERGAGGGGGYAVVPDAAHVPGAEDALQGPQDHHHQQDHENYEEHQPFPVGHPLQQT